MRPGGWGNVYQQPIPPNGYSQPMNPSIGIQNVHIHNHRDSYDSYDSEFDSNMGEMGCAAKCARICLTVFNIVMILFSLVMMILGGIFMSNYDAIQKLAKSAKFDKMLDDGSELMKKEGYEIDMDLNLDFIVDLIFKILKSVAVGMFVSGLFIFLISILGMCGACCKKKILMYAYAMLLSILLGAILIVLIVYSANPVKLFSYVEVALDDSIRLYKGATGNNTESQIWNLLQKQLKCCGNRNAKDFDKATDWNHMDNVKGTYTHVEYPYFCCNWKNPTCPGVFTSENSYIDTPCFDKLHEEMQIIKPIFKYTFLTIVILLVIVTIFSYFVAYKISKSQEYY